MRALIHFLSPQTWQGAVPAGVVWLTLLAVASVNAQVRLGPKGPEPANPNGQDEPKQADRSAPQQFELSISPSPSPMPALKYRLTPKYIDLKPGNASPYYYRAFKPLEWPSGEEGLAKIVEYLEPGALNDADLNEVASWFEDPVFSELLDQLRIAAYRENCDWGWRVRDFTGVDQFQFMLHELQDARSLGRVLSVKAGVQIRQHQFDQAIDTLMIGYRLAQDVAQQPFLVNQLVGIAIADMMNARVVGVDRHRELAQTSTGRSPRCHDRSSTRGVRLSMSMPYPLLCFHGCEIPESLDYSAEQWKQLIDDSRKTLGELQGTAAKTLPFAFRAALAYPWAKKELSESGLQPEEARQNACWSGGCRLGISRDSEGV